MTWRGKSGDPQPRSTSSSTFSHPSPMRTFLATLLLLQVLAVGGAAAFYPRMFYLPPSYERFMDDQARERGGQVVPTILNLGDNSRDAAVAAATTNFHHQPHPQYYHNKEKEESSHDGKGTWWQVLPPPPAQPTLAGARGEVVKVVERRGEDFPLHLPSATTLHRSQRQAMKSFGDPVVGGDGGGLAGSDRRYVRMRTCFYSPIQCLMRRRRK